MTDRLNGYTDTTVVSKRSECGEGILSVKTGRGEYDLLYDVVWKGVMSFMSVNYSLDVLHDVL